MIAVRVVLTAGYPKKAPATEQADPTVPPDNPAHAPPSWNLEPRVRGSGPAAQRQDRCAARACTHSGGGAIPVLTDRVTRRSHGRLDAIGR
jgi:hypothetical protein